MKNSKPKHSRSALFQKLDEMLNLAIMKMKNEHANFTVYTAAIWIDKEAKWASINFNSREHSRKSREKYNAYSKTYYDNYMKKGEIELAKLYAPLDLNTRSCNPADFELRDIVESALECNLRDWRNVLLSFGEYAFEKIKRELNVDESDFELGVNSEEDWYDESWHI